MDMDLNYCPWPACDCAVFFPEGTLVSRATMCPREVSLSEGRKRTEEGHRARERVLRWEALVIIQVDRLAGVMKRLTKQLANGRVESEVAGAYMDLRSIANSIEKLSKEES